MSASSPERRKLGSVEIEEWMIDGKPAEDRRSYYLVFPNGEELDLGSFVGEELYAAAEQFEALQALAREVKANVENRDLWPKEPLLSALFEVRAIGALGKEENQDG